MMIRATWLSYWTCISTAYSFFVFYLMLLLAFTTREMSVIHCLSIIWCYKKRVASIFSSKNFAFFFVFLSFCLPGRLLKFFKWVSGYYSGMRLHLLAIWVVDLLETRYALALSWIRFVLDTCLDCSRHLVLVRCRIARGGPFIEHLQVLIRPLFFSYLLNINMSFRKWIDFRTDLWFLNVFQVDRWSLYSQYMLCYYCRSQHWKLCLFRYFFFACSVFF